MKNLGENKICSHCRIGKKVSDFYRNKSTVDGFEYQCKICSLNTGKAWRKRNPDIVRNLKRKWREKNNSKCTNYHKKWRHENRDYINYTHLARRKLHYAIKVGKVIKLNCEICGDTKSQGHHEDYSKPLEVRWLCEKHHKELHNKCLN